MNTVQSVLYYDILDELQKNYNFSETNNVYGDNPHELLNNFVMLSGYRDLQLYDWFEVEVNGQVFYFGTLEVDYNWKGSRYPSSVREFQNFIIKRLDFDYGKLLIRPETIQDKVQEMFVKCEIDFANHPGFSSRYYFVADNKALARSFATDRRLTLIEMQRELHLEINNNMLLAKFARIVNYDDCIALLELGEML
jgi:hypothetical protein